MSEQASQLAHFQRDFTGDDQQMEVVVSQPAANLKSSAPVLSESMKKDIEAFRATRRSREQIRTRSSRIGPSENTREELAALIEDSDLDTARLAELCARSRADIRRRAETQQEEAATNAASAKAELDRQVARQLDVLGHPLAAPPQELVALQQPFLIAISNLDSAEPGGTANTEPSNSAARFRVVVNTDAHDDIFGGGLATVDFFYGWTNPHETPVSLNASAVLSAFGRASGEVYSGINPHADWANVGISASLTATQSGIIAPAGPDSSSPEQILVDLYENSVIDLGESVSRPVSQLYLLQYQSLTLPAGTSMLFTVSFEIRYAVVNGFIAADFSDIPENDFRVASPLVMLSVAVEDDDVRPAASR